MVIDTILLYALAFFALMIGGFLYFVTQNARSMRQQINRVAEQNTLVRADDRARQLCIAVHQLHPMMHAGVDFTIKRDAADNTPYIDEWNDSSPKPTDKELQEAFSRVAGKNYVVLRKAEYPSVGDQLDAAYKARHGDNSEQAQLDSIISEIKLKYPKSAACE
jgi:hypothetical protein